MNSVLLITQTRSNKSPNQFFEIIENLRINNFKFKRFYLSKGLKINMISQIFLPFFKFKLNKFIKKNNFNILFSTGLISDILVLFYLHSGKKVCFIRGHLPTVYNYKFPYFNIGYKLGILHYFIASKFDKVIVMTKSMQEEFEQFTKTKSTVIYNYAKPVICDLDKINHINIIKRNNKFINFGIVGTLITAKGIEDAIKGFSNFSKNYKNVRLCIYGDGKMKKIYEKLAKSLIPENQYKFYGYLEKKTEIYKNISVLIHPSFSEGTSRAVLEALSMHIIVIHRSIKGSDELIKNGFNGYLFDNYKDLNICLEKSFNKIKKFEINENKDIEYFLPYKYRLKYFKEKLSSFLTELY